MADVIVYPISISHFLIIEYDFFSGHQCVQIKIFISLRFPRSFVWPSDLVPADEKSNRGGLQESY